MKTAHLIKSGWATFTLVGPWFVYFVQPGKHLWVHAAAVVAGGLVMMFFSREGHDDERVAQLKLKALKAAFPVGIVFSLVMNMAILNPQEPDVTVRTVSAFDFAAATMLVALGLFYFWRWQDGQSQPSS